MVKCYVASRLDDPHGTKTIEHDVYLCGILIKVKILPETISFIDFDFKWARLKRFTEHDHMSDLIRVLHENT